MRPIRALAPGAAALALIMILAACGESAGDPSPSQPQSPSPSQSESPSPSEPAEPSDPASPAPSESPTASPIEVAEIDLPVIARITEDGVEVLTHPVADAPVIIAEDLDSDGEEPDVVLDTDAMVLVTLGPVYSDDESWYEVAAADGSELHFAFGWVPASVLEPMDEPSGFAPMAVIHGQGEGASVDVDVDRGSPSTVRFAAVPMPEAEACDIDVTLVRTDGAPVNVATNTVEDVLVFELGAQQLGSLFQEEAGTVTLEVETDCSFAASLITP